MNAPLMPKTAANVLAFHPRAVPRKRNDAVLISCEARARKGLQPGLDAQLRKLYCNIHSTFAHLGIYGGLDAVTHVYVARRAEEPLAVLLLERNGSSVRVVNEGMRIEVGELQRFAAHAFGRWSQVHALSLNAVQIEDAATPGHPLQHFPCTADVVVTLPTSVDAYTESLGKNMRRNLRRYMSKLEARHPELRHVFFESADVSAQQVREILRLSRARISNKSLAFSIDEAETERIIALTQQSGMTGVLMAGDRIIAGGIGYRAGDAFFYRIVAHDPAYDDCSAGILMSYLMICECIARGCREFNFMRSPYEYKFALGAQTRYLQQVVVYRSRLHQFLVPRLVVANLLAQARRRLDLLLTGAVPAAEQGSGERMLLHAVHGWRALKRRFRLR
ncbi:MAG TPA: GNAT family N-acetyltransferase [Noviherbaspirillum sp.]